MAAAWKFQIDEYGDWVGRVQTPKAKSSIRISKFGRGARLDPNYIVTKGKVMVGVAWSTVSKRETKFIEIEFNDKLWDGPQQAVLKICDCGCGAYLSILP